MEKKNKERNGKWEGWKERRKEGRRQDFFSLLIVTIIFDLLPRSFTLP